MYIYIYNKYLYTRILYNNGIDRIMYVGSTTQSPMILTPWFSTSIPRLKIEARGAFTQTSSHSMASGPKNISSWRLNAAEKEELEDRVKQGECEATVKRELQTKKAQASLDKKNAAAAVAQRCQVQQQQLAAKAKAKGKAVAAAKAAAASPTCQLIMLMLSTRSITPRSRRTCRESSPSLGPASFRSYP